MRYAELVWQDEQGNPVNPFANMKLVSHNNTGCSFCGYTYVDSSIYEDKDGDQHERGKDCPVCWKQWHDEAQGAF